MVSIQTGGSMCGIAGIIKSGAERYKRNVQRMVDSLKHRGPDGSGTYFYGNCGLGHTRLSVIDLKYGNQPMLSHNQKTAITFNGEIYGFRQIKDKLLDYPFGTKSDTEVILALYREYGEGLLHYLPGMFAFAIWDDLQQKLFCARDRFGEKPFYYSFGSDGEFIFASEIKALLATGLIEPIIDVDSIIHYLQRLYVNPYKTIYQNVHILPPAHTLSYQNKQLQIQPYWELPKTNSSIGISDATDRFRDLFDQAVKRQLVADVPVAMFVSGGLDSSTVLAVASKHQNKLRTFSFGFEGSISELPYAREVTNYYKTEHVELRDEHNDIGELLVKMQDVYDEPFADSSNIPTYLMCKLASQYGKVVLNR